MVNRPAFGTSHRPYAVAPPGRKSLALPRAAELSTYDREDPIWFSAAEDGQRGSTSPSKSALASLLVEIQPEVLKDPNGGRATCAKDTSARVLEGPDQVEALDAGDGELSEIRCRAV